MGVEWLSCERCGNTFPDCGDFVRCNDDCCKEWCDDDCAKADGYTRAKCKLGLCISIEGFLEDDNSECPKWCNSDGRWCDCEGCENYMPTSCNYCRHEEYEDGELLMHCLKALDITREELIKYINEEKEIMSRED